MKECFKCGLSKPLSDYYRHSRMADGHLNKCKECAKADVKTHRQENPEKLAAYEKVRSQTPKRKELATRTVRAARAAHPERQQARNLVAKAVKAGTLQRAPCWVCGDKAEAHHPDYSSPLDVVWLCSRHHKQAHALVNH